ncbi:MAG: TetR/AcrR family transcriptional regulator [Anaerolineae bacterium]|nr:MAG: TetR/AcrR family transcriptional regulator [Anaerolineae bacterium]
MNKTQHNILNAAFEVLAQDFSAPLEKIAERAGVTRATLHRYYNSREALMEGATIELCRLTKAIVDEATASHATPLQQLKAVVMKSAELGNRYHFLMHAMEHEQHDPKFRYVEQQLADLIDAVRQKGLIRPDVPTPWIIHVYYGIMSASWRALKDGGVAPKQIPELAWQTFTSGLFVDGRG